MFPYDDLPDKSWWPRDASPSTLRKRLLTIRSKADFSDSRFMTAGSCFAQRISKHLRSLGVNILDYEPPPKELDEQRCKKTAI